MKQPRSPEILHVVAAAIIGHGGVPVHLPPPARHHSCISHMVHELGYPKPIKGEQGFMLSDGTFADRKKAAAVAIESGQIPKLNWPPNLYSEDLW